jgi:hypothetical protein
VKERIEISQAVGKGFDIFIRFLNAAYSSPWWWRQYARLKRRSTSRLHGAVSQKAVILMNSVFSFNPVSVESPSIEDLPFCKPFFPVISFMTTNSNFLGSLFIAPLRNVLMTQCVVAVCDPLIMMLTDAFVRSGGLSRCPLRVPSMVSATLARGFRTFLKTSSRISECTLVLYWNMSRPLPPTLFTFRLV